MRDKEKIEQNQMEIIKRLVEIKDLMTNPDSSLEMGEKDTRWLAVHMALEDEKPWWDVNGWLVACEVLVIFLFIVVIFMIGVKR